MTICPQMFSRNISVTRKAEMSNFAHTYLTILGPSCQNFMLIASYVTSR